MVVDHREGGYVVTADGWGAPPGEPSFEMEDNMDCPGSDDSTIGVKRGVVVLLWVAAALVLLSIFVRAGAIWRSGAAPDRVPGIWITLAQDFADGVFYRPLMDERGYGGTYFMPLHFVLHGTLIRAGLGPMFAGYLITLLSGVGLLAGVFHFLRVEGLEKKIGIPLTLLVLSTAPAKLAVTVVRGDLLPAALGVWGLAFCASRLARKDRPNLFLPALLFALAILAKITCVFGLAAAVLAFFLLKEWKTGWKILGLTTVMVLAGCAVVYLASGGRVLESLGQCGSAGAGITSVLSGPVHMFDLYLRADPTGLIFLILAAGGLLTLSLKSWRELPSLALLTTVVMTVPIFCVPGTSYNNLLDLNVIVVVFLGVQLAKGSLQRGLVVGVVALTALVSSAHPFWLIGRPVSSRGETDCTSVFTEPATSGKPLLCEDAGLLVKYRLRPYMLDPFMFRVASQRRPEIAADFERKLVERHFRAVVLVRNPETESGRRRYRKVHFGGKFLERLLENYERSGECDTLFIYRPRRPASPS